MRVRPNARVTSIEAAVGALAANVRIWRERAGRTQEEAAEAAEVSVIYFKQLEHGSAANPSLAVLVAVANALDVEPAELLRYQPPPVARPPGRPVASRRVATLTSNKQSAPAGRGRPRKR